MRSGSLSWVCALAVAAGCLATGCLDAGSQRCADGSVCAPGLACATIADTTMCVAPDQFAACNGIADGTRCATSVVLVGSCIAGACISSGCGNGITELDEACDDGNLISGDGCSADCQSTEVCGNKITDRGEQCDCGTADAVNPDCPGPNSDTSGPCSLDCHLRCGDGIVSPDEGCDPAAATTVSCAGDVFDRGLTTCSASCQPIISGDSCRYIGFRTRAKQTATPGPNDPLITDLAPVSASAGFFVRGRNANTYVDFVTIGNAYVSSTPLAAVWAANPTTAFAVGAQGKAVHFTGTWQSQPTPTTADLRDVWGRSATDVYAVGDSTVLRWNGTAWTSLAPPPGNYRAITGDATHLYIAGDQGKVATYDGTQWTIESAGTTADLLAVAAAGSLVVAVGTTGTIVHRAPDGTWSAGRTNATATLRGVWGSTADGFFAAGDRGTVLFFDGAVWRPLTLGRGIEGAPDQSFLGVIGIAGVTVGVIGTQDIASYEGAAWSPTTRPTAQTLYGLWGSAPDDIFAVGRNGTILHHDGLTWTQQPAPTTADLRAVYGSAANDVYVAGDDLTLLHYDGTQWTALASGTGSFSSVFAPATNQVLATAADGIYRFDGTALTRISTTSTRAIWGTSAADVWAAGTSINHFNGSTWTMAVALTDVRALAGSSPTDVFAVGKTSYHFDGGTWSAGPFQDSRLTAVCTTADHGAFAVGREGTLRYWGGTAIEPFVSHTTTDLAAVFVTGHVLVMAGADGTLDTMVFHR